MLYSLRNLRTKQVALLISLGFVLLQYQNCSSSPDHLFSNRALANDSGGKAAVNEDDGNHQIVVDDPVSVGPIFFPETEYSVEPGDEDPAFIGVCEQNGSLIGWKISQGETVIQRDLAECEAGFFEITIDHDHDQPWQWQDYCGEEPLILKAALGANASAEIQISIPCASE